MKYSKYCTDCIHYPDSYTCEVCKGKPLFFREKSCKLCGGRLSEVRTDGKKQWRHCFSCHMEFPEEGEKNVNTGEQNEAGAD